jgi:prepilin-type N-terminal cleavage/methylation domain-containing protein
MIIDAHHKRSCDHSGFSLPEAMLALVILAMAAAGVLLPFASGASVQAEGMHQSLGASLANDLLERVTRTPFTQIMAAPPTGWCGYREAQGQIKDASGTTTFTDPIYANYSREVTCASDPAQPFFILVTVRVSYLGRPVAVVRRLISE